MIDVTYFTRKPFKGYHSIEELFTTILKYLPGDIAPTWKQLPFQSIGCVRRIINILWAPFHQGKVNHITGDIHFIALFLRKKKTILTIHDLEIISRNSGLHRALLLIFWFYIPLRRVRIITVISEFTRTELHNYVHVPECKIRVIPDCLPGKLPYTPNTFNASSPTILQVGTKPNKNICNLIRALKGISCKLIILGDISEEQRDLMKRNSIKFECQSGLNYDQVIALYIKADMLAFVSTYEGFGLPILEAHSIGRPVITSNVSSMPEVAADAAVYVDPFDVVSIQQGILKVIHDENLRTELIKKGLENVKRFQPEIISEKYASLYRELSQS